MKKKDKPKSSLGQWMNSHQEEKPTDKSVKEPAQNEKKTKPSKKRKRK